MKTKTIVLLFLACGAAYGADPRVYFGENVSPWPIDGPNDVPIPTNLLATLQAAATFHSRLPGVLAETFESFTTGQVPLSLTFGTNVAMLSGGSRIATHTDPALARGGGFPFSGTNVLELVGGSGQFFAVSFTVPQSAFGFFATDVELNQLRLTFVHTNSQSEDILVPITTPQGSGGACFFGFIDRANPFIAVEFHNDGPQPDGFHFDDLTIAPPEQVCPEPALLSIGLYAGIDIRGATGVTYRIEYTTDLPYSPTTNWTVLTNIALSSSPYFYLDRESVASRRGRFYRAVTDCP